MLRTWIRIGGVDVRLCTTHKRLAIAFAVIGCSDLVVSALYVSSKPYDAAVGFAIAGICFAMAGAYWRLHRQHPNE